MKIPQQLIICLCFLASLCSYPASGSIPSKAQTSLQKETIPLSKAIDEVVNVYQVNIVYDVEQVAGKNISNWSIQHQSVEAELKELQRKSAFNFKKLGEATYIIKVERVDRANKIAKRHKEKQAFTKIPKAIIKVSGRVYDLDNNDPLIGVNILVKGKDIGTATDFDGNFSLEVEEGRYDSEELEQRVNQSEIIDQGRHL